MKTETQSKIEATIGTLVGMLLLFLLLWFMSFTSTTEPEDEGIEVAFGDADTGGGMEDGLLAANASAEAVAPAPAPSAPSMNDLMTQEDEESLALARQREKDEQARRKAEADRLQQQRAEAERKEAERIAEERRLAEQKAKQQAQIDKANQLGALFGQTNSAEGAHGDAGSSASSATKGVPTGHGVSGGNSWSLNGRSLKGSLPKPSNNFNQEGVVVVNIIVDAQGKVVSATVGAGTTISDETTRQLAVKAAMKAEFNGVDRPDKAFGKITYYFKFT